MKVGENWSRPERRRVATNTSNKGTRGVFSGPIIVFCYGVPQPTATLQRLNGSHLTVRGRYSPPIVLRRYCPRSAVPTPEAQHFQTNMERREDFGRIPKKNEAELYGKAKVKLAIPATFASYSHMRAIASIASCICDDFNHWLHASRLQLPAASAMASTTSLHL